MRSLVLVAVVGVVLGGCRGTPEASVVLGQPSGLEQVTIFAKGME